MVEGFWNIFQFIGKVAHWVTGFLVHPEKGGCCGSSDLFKTIEDQKEKFDK